MMQQKNFNKQYFIYKTITFTVATEHVNRVKKIENQVVTTYSETVVELFRGDNNTSSIRCSC
jgi:hypothetical protein